MNLDGELLDALDAPSQTLTWPGSHLGPIAEAKLVRAAPIATEANARTESAAGHGSDSFATGAILAVASALENAEAELTRMDQVVGDGDLGISLARGARAVRQELPHYPQEDLPGMLRALSATLRRVLGGTSGPLYAIGLLRAAQALEQVPGNGGEALSAAATGIAEVGGASVGDRTMLDALIPAAGALAEASGEPWAVALRRAAIAADAGCAATAAVAARRGRASYLGDRAIGHPDPGAKAVAHWLQALAAHAEGTSQ
jgi:dihydroxyacetone kinase